MAFNLEKKHIKYLKNYGILNLNGIEKKIPFIDGYKILI
jgi:hypothetical protein